MATLAKPTTPDAAGRHDSPRSRRCRARSRSCSRPAAVLAPLSLILYQSLLTAPFFDARKTRRRRRLRVHLRRSRLLAALRSTRSLIAAGMTVDRRAARRACSRSSWSAPICPGKRWIEPLLLVPSFVSPMVLAFGYVVAAGPVGFYSVWATDVFGGAPWGIYSLAAIGVIAGLTHVPNVYVYASAALKSLGSDVEEAARVAGASPFRVATDGQPAADHAGAAVLRGAGLLPRLRALRPAAGARRSRRPPGAVDLPLQADQQARHAVVPPDGRGGDLHRRGDVSAGAAAALPAAERAQVRDDQGQGRTHARAAARRGGSGSRSR